MSEITIPKGSIVRHPDGRKGFVKRNWKDEHGTRYVEVAWNYSKNPPVEVSYLTSHEREDRVTFLH